MPRLVLALALAVVSLSYSPQAVAVRNVVGGRARYGALHK
jgi:hypothetical protein